jgi:hypothetical protein
VGHSDLGDTRSVDLPAGGFLLAGEAISGPPRRSPRGWDVGGTRPVRPRPSARDCWLVRSVTAGVRLPHSSTIHSARGRRRHLETAHPDSTCPVHQRVRLHAESLPPSAAPPTSPRSNSPPKWGSPSPTSAASRIATTCCVHLQPATSPPLAWPRASMVTIDGQDIELDLTALAANK